MIFVKQPLQKPSIKWKKRVFTGKTKKYQSFIFWWFSFFLKYILLHESKIYIFYFFQVFSPKVPGKFFGHMLEICGDRPKFSISIEIVSRHFFQNLHYIILKFRFSFFALKIILLKLLKELQKPLRLLRIFLPALLTYFSPLKAFSLHVFLGKKIKNIQDQK